MSGKGKRGALGGVVFGLGIIALLIGALTDVYSTVVGVIIMLAIWFVLGPIIGIMTKGGRKQEAPPQQDQPQEEQRPDDQQGPQVQQ